VSSATASAPPGTQASDKWTRLQTATILILCGALFMDAMDVSSLNVALPTIGSHLHMSPSSLQWVVSGYVLGYGGFLLLGGRTADLLGRRRVFLIGITVFAAASALGGIVDNGTVLIATRFIKGMGAAFTVPAGLSILTTTFPEGPSRYKALGVWAATAAVGFTLGLVFGGLLSQLGWRYVILVPAPIAGLLAVVATRVLIKDKDAPTGRRSYDFPGAVTITASMALLVYSVVEAPNHGWADVRTIGGLVLSAALIGAFVLIERRTKEPLVRLGIFRNYSLISADLGALLFFASYLGFQFLATLYVQDVAGWSPLNTSLAFLPSGVFLMAFGAQAPRLIGAFGTRTLIAGGLALLIGGYALFLRENSTSLDYVTMLLPTIILLGLGWTFAFPALNVQGTSGVDGGEEGLAAGLFNTGFQIGGAIGTAIISAVLTSRISSHGSTASGIMASIRPAMFILMICAALGIVVVLAASRSVSKVGDLEAETLLATEGSEVL
jgi:EmrB/QacA subfamily drug resistance transporter